MRKLTLDEKISLKGKLERFNYVNPKLDMNEVLWIWPRCYGKPIAKWFKIQTKKGI